MAWRRWWCLGAAVCFGMVACASGGDDDDDDVIVEPPDAAVAIDAPAMPPDAAPPIDAPPPAPDAPIVFPDAATPPDATPSACNPVSQIGCAAGEKCALILDDPSVGGGHVGCAPDGTGAIGDACTEPTVPGATDDCAAGGDCYRGTCHEICSTIVDTCTDGACVTFVDGLGNPIPVNICLPNCDLLLQDCVGAGEGCYIAAGEAVCVGAGTLSEGDTCAFSNACSPGLMCVGSTMGGFFCRRFCGPWMDCFDAGGAPTTCGCGDTVACAADEICFGIGDGMGGTIDDTAGVCIPDADSSCDCSATPICP